MVKMTLHMGKSMLIGSIIQGHQPAAAVVLQLRKKEQSGSEMHFATSRRNAPPCFDPGQDVQNDGTHVRANF